MRKCRGKSAMRYSWRVKILYRKHRILQQRKDWQVSIGYVDVFKSNDLILRYAKLFNFDNSFTFYFYKVRRASKKTFPSENFVSSILIFLNSWLSFLPVLPKLQFGNLQMKKILNPSVNTRVLTCDFFKIFCSRKNFSEFAQIIAIGLFDYQRMLVT